ncbi:MAG: PIN domain-containing protein [Caulobacteraceae bacterium]
MAEQSLRLAFDTNILVYGEGVVRAASDSAKCAVAARLIIGLEDAPIIIARQALAEFHAVLVRKDGQAPADAAASVHRWVRRSRVVDTDATVFEAALELASDHGIPIFDAVILAAAVEARCDLLLSEDFHDGFAWRGVVVSNPFGPAPDARVTRFLASAS